MKRSIILVGRGGTVLVSIGLAALVPYPVSAQSAETLRILAVSTIPLGLVIAMPWLVTSLKSRFQRPKSQRML